MSSIRDTRRPLTARSVVASTLLGVDPPRLPALALVRSGELFGLSEGATRTALSRMTANGEVAGDGGHYALTGPLLDRHVRQQEARAPSTRAWDGAWIAAVVAGERRSAADRAAFRDAAGTLKLAEIREGLWMRPDDRDHDRTPDATAVVDSQAMWMRGIRPDEPATLVGAFPLAAWSDRARRLLDDMDEWQPALDARRVDVLGPTFVLDADVVRHLVSDPDLPSTLLGDDWPGPRLRAAFGRFDAAFKSTWRHWYRSFQDS